MVPTLSYEPRIAVVLNTDPLEHITVFSQILGTSEYLKRGGAVVLRTQLTGQRIIHTVTLMSPFGC